jgi:hypothetical protein
MGSINIRQNVDFGKNQIFNVVLQNLTTAPSSPAGGQLYFDTTTGNNRLRIYNPTPAAWQDIIPVTGTAPIVATEAASVTTITISAATGSTAGSMSAADKTKLDAATSLSTNSTLVLRDGSGDFSAHNITANVVTGLAAPSSATDAANKTYVDQIASGLYGHAEAEVVALTNQTLSGLPTVDGITLTDAQYILLTGQTTGSQNGLWQVHSGAWTRPTEMPAGASIRSGAVIFIRQGTTYINSQFALTGTGAITVDTTAQNYIQINGASEITAGAGLTKTGNTIDIVGTTNRIIVNTDSIDISSSYVGQTSITTLGTVTTGTWHGTAISEVYGGTNQTGYALGDILYASATNTLLKLGGNTTTTRKFLRQTGNGSISASPAWDTLVAADYPVMGAASSGSGGTQGAVPAPTAGQQTYFLRGDATWVAISGGGTVNKFSGTFPGTVGSAPYNYTIAHSLGTADLSVTLYDISVSPAAVILADITVDATNIYVSFSTAPTTNQYRVVATG